MRSQSYSNVTGTSLIPCPGTLAHLVPIKLASLFLWRLVSFLIIRALDPGHLNAWSHLHEIINYSFQPICFSTRWWGIWGDPNLRVHNFRYKLHSHPSEISPSDTVALLIESNEHSTNCLGANLDSLYPVLQYPHL